MSKLHGRIVRPKKQYPPIEQQNQKYIQGPDDVQSCQPQAVAIVDYSCDAIQYVRHSKSDDD